VRNSKQIIPWTDELIEQVKQLWLTHTTEQIATLIGYPGHRAAIIGKLKRLGVKSPRRRGAGNSNAKGLKHTPAGLEAPSPGDRPQLRDREPVRHRPRLHKPVPVPLMELTSETCRWPLWSDRMPLQAVKNPMFCGMPPAWEGCSWCAVHLEAAVTPSRRQAVTAGAMKAIQREGQSAPHTRPSPQREKSAGPLTQSRREEWPQGLRPEQEDEQRELAPRN
jgi:hypothetical protein